MSLAISCLLQKSSICCVSFIPPIPEPARLRRALVSEEALVRFEVYPEEQICYTELCGGEAYVCKKIKRCYCGLL